MIVSVQGSMPATVPIRIYRGDRLSFGVLIKPGGVAMDLTGSTVRAQIRRSADHPQVLATFQVTPDPEVTGRVEAVLEEVITASLPVGPWVWDLELEDSLGHVRTLVRGPAEVIADVTRPA